MQTVQAVLREDADFEAALAPLVALRPDLVFAFGRSGVLAAVTPSLARLSTRGAWVFSCVLRSLACCRDGIPVVTGVRFEHARIVEMSAALAGMESSFDTGRQLAAAVPKAGLRAVLLLGQGVGLNGGTFLAGFNEVLGAGVPVIGGLASRHEGYYATLVLDDSGVDSGTVVALGLYGERLRFGFGAHGGWVPLPARRAK